MKRYILLLIATFTIATLSAQPPKRRAEDAVRSAATRNAPTGVSYRDFPTAQAMPQDVAWRRDLYRVLNLKKDANAVLYYPTTPQDGRENLFTYLFHLLLRRQIKAYDYKLDGNEDFSAANEVTARTLMDRYHIYYEAKDGHLRVNDADLPSEDVKLYYLKESTYYDQHTATFRTKVVAICPVIVRGDSEFGGTDQNYPMFWVRFDEVAPKLGKLMLMESNYNNAATLSADDYFTLGRYEGDIYKAVNLQDRLLSNYCPSDSDMHREQARIEKQLKDVRKGVWGEEPVVKKPEAAATDTAAVAPEAAAPKRRITARRRTTTRTKSPKVSTPSTKEPKSSKTTKAAGFSVRRQRH